MILQALHTLYNRKKDDLPPPGFESKEIPFLIVIDKNGQFIALQDTRTKDGKKLFSKKFTVPKEKEGRSGKNAWKMANILWDHYGYVLGWPKSENDSDIQMAKKQHQSFKTAIALISNTYPNNIEIQAVKNFLAKETFDDVFASQEWQDCRKIKGCNLSFILEGSTRLVCENEDIQSWCSDASTNEEDADESNDLQDKEGICLVTGERAVIARLNPRTPILGARSNAKIVAFQTNMGFDSYGKEQSYNAPVSKKASFAYSTALSYLLAKESKQKLLAGDATTVFWAEKEHQLENVFADFFGEPAKDDQTQDIKSLIAALRAPQIGARPELDPQTKFYVLGLAPNAARIAVRFWYEGTVQQILDHIEQHFDDCTIIHGPKQPETLSLFRLLVSTAVQGKSENIQPNLAGDMMRAILAGTPYPKSLLSSAIRRVRAEREITYPRAALIKAVLARDARYYNSNQKEVGMSLDITNNNTGYRLGRLFAVLEKVQEEANPGLNATIRDRFYGAASSTPVAVFALLMKLKNHHIAKLENRGRAINFEKLIGEIMSGISEFPAQLSLPDQGRFAVGYYHQRQDFFITKENKNNN
ncbi:MAG TPA: type I-C CRISPR-associated protein Cas8c/Csd1 [Smithellaceae bacterium]|jgi:CRISPR-associated protein Csd1|nr:type I-C CRISPR-associated protein Cas8c/Csd1 [Smithellaceae bacterium]